MPGNDFSTIFEATGNIVAAPVLNQPGGNPVLSTLADGLGTVAQELDNSRTRRRQAASDAREQIRFEQENQDRLRAQQERDARSAAYRAIYGTNRALSAPATPVANGGQPISGTPMSLASISETSAFHQDTGNMATALIDGAVETGETDASTVRRIRDAAAAAAPVIQSQEVAVSQGRMPSLAVAASVDRIFGDLINRFPGNESIIAAAFKEMGVDNALFDELRTEVNRVSADRTQEQETRDQAYSRGVEDLGDAAANTPHDEIVQIGLRGIRADAQLEALSKQISLQSQQQNILTGQAALDDRQTRLTGEEAYSQATAIGIQQLAPDLERYNRLVAMIGQPGANPGIEASLAELETQIIRHKGTIIGNLIAAIAPNGRREDVEALRTTLDTYFDETFIKPMTARSGENARAIEVLQTRANLGIQTAVPFISALRSMGISAAAIPGLMEHLPEPMLERFGQEVRGLATLDFTQPTARQQLVEIVEILNGNQTLSSLNYDSRTASQMFRSINGVARSLATTINRSGDTSSGNEFLSAAGEIIVATRQLNRGTPSQSLINAGQSLLGPNFGGSDMVGAITRLKNDPTQADRANIIARGYRAASAQTLQNLRNTTYGESGRFQIMWRSGRVAGQDYGDGRYQIVDTQSGRTPSASELATENAISAEMPGGTAGITARHANARPHQDLQDMVRTMNGLVDVLVQTNDWGDGARGTPREIRRFYARGEVPAGMRNDRRQAESRDATIRREINSLREDLLNPDSFTLQTDNTPSSTGGRDGRPARVPRGQPAVALDGNNPGGINDGEYAQGQPGYVGGNGRYAAFETMAQGEAAARNLLSSYIQRGFNTPMEIARRYAPRLDGNDPVAYANRVARALRINPNDTIPPSRVGELASAMFGVENHNYRSGR